MAPVVLCGSANPELAVGIAHALDTEVARCTRERFPDGERHIQLRHDVRGKDVYVVQPTAPPVEGHLVELLLMVDACRRSGARRVTAVTPYFGYARQDRRRHAGEPLSARVVADLFSATKVDRVVTVDPHSGALESMFGTAIECVGAVPVLAAVLAATSEPGVEGAVVVAPDLGAAKLAEGYAAVLGVPVAIVRKKRVSGDVVHVEKIVGEVAGRTPIVVDDMISTGATVVAAAHALLDAGSRSPLHVVATHGLLVGKAAERLGEIPLHQVLVTDTVAVPSTPSLPVNVVSVAPLLADVIGRLHTDRSIDDLVLYR
jgi:ribose-phosphate pyrophosphokinase